MKDFWFQVFQSVNYLPFRKQQSKNQYEDGIFALNLMNRLILFWILLKRMNVSKLYNIAKVILSYTFTRIFKTAIQWGMPIRLSVEPTTACNLRCPQCPSGLRSFKRPTGHLSMESYCNWIRPLTRHLYSLNFYFQGEPFLHPQIFQAIKFASKQNILTTSSTNGHFLSSDSVIALIESGLDILTISVDGIDQETYEKYRIGGKLEKVINGIEQLVIAKRRLSSKTPYIIFQFILFQHNVHQMNEARKLARSLGCDEIRFKTAQVYDYSNGSKLIPEESLYARYAEGQSGEYVLKSELPNRCFRLWNAPVVTWDGQLVPCCFDKDAEYVMGNLQQTSLLEIWNGKKYRSFRNQMTRDRKDIQICKNCSEGSKIWI